MRSCLHVCNALSTPHIICSLASAILCGPLHICSILMLNKLLPFSSVLFLSLSFTWHDMLFLFIYLFLYYFYFYYFKSYIRQERYAHVKILYCQSSISGKEMKGEVLFNDALNTFYLRLYGVGHMVKDHSYSERGSPLPPYVLLFPINSMGYFISTIPQTG